VNTMRSAMHDPNRASERGASSPVPARRRRAGERGFTLAEMLVAVTVMAIVFVAAFTLYDNLQKSFKRSENAANQQQNTRVAFDRMVADVRMAGFNYNPDGAPNRPDEQIEGMWDTAITVRGDYDFEDPATRTTPESTLGGPTATFRTVTIGNDEIVTYALGKPNGAGGTSISFVADVTGVPRNGSQETVSISNVHTTPSTPPYTLYRYTVSPNSTTVVKQPVADNVRSLNFTYYDGSGTVLTAIGGAEDPNSIAMRKRIAKVGIRVEGMTENPDMAYIDPTDANGQTRHYRKYVLQSDVTPRNLGYVGVVDIDLDDPNAPTSFTACQGHCNGTYLKWAPGGDSDIASYTVSWGTSPSTLVNVVSTPDMNFYVNGVTGPQYYAVRAVDLTGNQSNNVTVGPSTPNDTTTPAQVTGVTGTGDAGGVRAAVKNSVTVAWPPVTGNTTNLVCDDSPYPIRDLKGYRAFKGTSASFDPNNVSQVVQSWDPNTLAANVNTFNDSQVVNCRRYYYKVAAEDLCAKRGAVSAAADAASTTTVPPAAPTGVTATDMGRGLHRVTWNRVSTDTDVPPSNILIDKYIVYRAAVPTASDPRFATYTQVFSGLISTPASPMWEDPNVPNLSGSQNYWYKVTALDDCPNEGQDSLPDEADKCNLGGTVFLSVSPGGSQVTGAQTITISTSGGVTVASTQLVIRDKATGAVVYNQTDNVAPYTYTWNASSVPAGRTYEIIGAVTNDVGCTDSASTAADTVTAVACCISSSNPNLSPATGSLKSNELFFDIVNNCGADVTITAMNVTFSNNAGRNPLLDELSYNIFDLLSAERVFNLSPDLPSPVSFSFGSALGGPLLLSASNNNLFPVRMRHRYTQPLLNKVGATFVGETIRTDFFFQVSSMSGVGRCDVTVVTNPLSVVSCDPANDPTCGN
jgi:prepilin-type N-terminal cleavage/methylation domain-containing protein